LSPACYSRHRFWPNFCSCQQSLPFAAPWTTSRPISWRWFAPWTY
jgi:hypothetical protein